MSTVQLREISLRYGRQNVLQGVNLTVQSGQYMVILGESGCGKTSILRMVAGLLSPTSGHVMIAGKDMTSVAPRHRDIALVPQQAGLYPHLTIGRCIGMGIRERLGRADRRQRIKEAAEIVELETLLDRLPEQLSGGQLRRAAVAKAIASRASVRLLDEPLSAIDANLRYQIERDLSRLHQETPGVTIHVTHDAEEAVRLADVLAVIEDGNIVQVDAPSKVRANPVSPGVAGVMGRSPFIVIGMKRRQDKWVSEDGHEIAADRQATMDGVTVGYYEEDLQPLHAESGRSGILAIGDGRQGVTVDKLRWFPSEKNAGREPAGE